MKDHSWRRPTDLFYLENPIFEFKFVEKTGFKRTTGTSSPPNIVEKHEVLYCEVIDGDIGQTTLTETWRSINFYTLFFMKHLYFFRDVPNPAHSYFHVSIDIFITFISDPGIPSKLRFLLISLHNLTYLFLQICGRFFRYRSSRSTDRIGGSCMGHFDSFCWREDRCNLG